MISSLVVQQTKKKRCSKLLTKINNMTAISKQDWFGWISAASIDEYDAATALVSLKQGRLVNNNTAKKKSLRQRAASKKSWKKISSPASPSPSCYPVGTRMAKGFFVDDSVKKKMFLGVILKFNSRTRKYSVRYDDGDEEVISAKEMGALVDKATKKYCRCNGCTTLARVEGFCYKHYNRKQTFSDAL